MSRSKGNQTMKIGQLMEYKIRKISLEKLYTKSGGETISRSFSRKSKLSISLDQSILQSFIQFVFIVCQVEGY